jgi:hypothetical protein
MLKVKIKKMNQINPINHSSFLGFETVFKYGSDFINDPVCERDGVAPQVDINASGLVPNVFIPEAKNSIRNFLDAHYIDNYGWLCTNFEAKQTITKRNP